MNIVDEYLLLTISAAESAIDLLRSSEGEYLREHSYQKDLHCEIKAKADRILEELIFEHLMPTGLSILSEEMTFSRASFLGESSSNVSSSM